MIPSKLPLMERFRTSSIESILSRDVPPVTSLTPLIVDNYNAHLSFYVTMIRDPRFDVLTPPINLFAKQRPGVIFEFYDEVFVTIYPDGASVSQVYTPHFLPVLGSLETGIMTRDCAILLKKTMNCYFSNGCVICKCVDHRITPTREITTKLEIGADVLQYFCEGHSQDEVLEGEKRCIEMRRPIICTDPSPDVARVQSALDFRKKMWRTRKERLKMEEMVRKPMERREDVKFGGVKIEERRSKVKIPERLLRTCARRH
jgi:PHD/YefM family antitoxin component YafN of YafNO toxin-antitoxin module